MRVFEQDEKIRHHVYRKWQRPHWTLTCLALIDYPPGDTALRPLVHRVHDWLFSRPFLEPPLTAIYPGQEDLVHHCASMDDNAIWYSVRLALEDERTRTVVDRLIDWQWPDGGWNCDKRPRPLCRHSRNHSSPPAVCGRTDSRTATNRPWTPPRRWLTWCMLDGICDTYVTTP